jgi:hypothetical protein
VLTVIRFPKGAVGDVSLENLYWNSSMLKPRCLVGATEDGARG